MAVDTEDIKKPLSEAQRAHIEALAESNRARSTARPLSRRGTFLARHQIRSATTVEGIDEIEEQELDGRRGVRSPFSKGHGLAGQVTVEHNTGVKVKLWKRGPYGWIPREVPSHSVAPNLANGWMEYCPDCGTTDCELDPNTCEAKRGRAYIVCPVVQANGTPCGKRIFSTMRTTADRHPGEFEVADAYANITPELELRGKMDQHLLTWHHDEARILGVFDRGPDPRHPNEQAS